MEDTSALKSPDEIAFDEMNAALDQLKDKRATLSEQLADTTRTTKIDFENDAPRKTEMKLSLFKTLDDLIKSQESLYMGKTKLSLQKKSEATNDSVKQMAVEILKNINMKDHINSPVETTTTDDDALKKAYADLDEDPEHAIKESELEIPQT